MTTSSRNPAVANMALTDGDEETKAYVKNHYGIPDSVNDWPTIDDMAEEIQRQRNAKWHQSK